MTRPIQEAEPLPPPDRDSVLGAAGRIRGVAHRTPIHTSRILDEELGCSVHLKCETFQRTGSFKFRGAYNALASLPAESRARGILTYSSGNHAQAVALAGRLLGCAVTVVMPRSAPAVKRQATEGYGAAVVTYDPGREIREEVALRLASERTLSVIPPYDHPRIVAGQGTAALELLEDVPELELILAPCGGGGLLSGTALAASADPGCLVVGVEPALADDATRTFRTGVLHTVENPPTIADGLRTPSLGAVTWPIIQRHVHDMLTVSEDQIVDAMRFLWSRAKLVVEPSGAVALAALRANPEIGAGKRVGVILSGGNVDLPV
jgi:threo-3-hydroxy-L-aspartate ammonia-lyase